MASLVNKSIIVRHQATDHTTAWYEILEIVRQYAAAKLVDSDGARQARIRHRDHYRALAARYGAESFGPSQGDWFIRLRREQSNLRTALEFCLEDPGGAAAAFDIVAPLWNFWFAGFLREGYLFMSRALDLAPERTPGRAHALWAASYLAMFAGDFDRTAVMLAECEEIAAGLDDGLLNARIKECRGHAALYQGDIAGAIELLQEARAEFRAVGDALGEFDTLILLTAGAFFSEDDRIDEFSEGALTLAASHGALSSKAYGYWAVGIARWRARDYAGGSEALRECVRLFQPMHDLTGISFGVQGLSWCAAFASPDERAARLLGASQAIWRTSGAKVDETNAYGGFDKLAQEAVRTALGEALFEQRFAEGAGFSFDQAVAFALADHRAPGAPDTPAGASTTAAGDAVLTRREGQIADLLAEGLSNKEIAARLVISQRTVETHVDHILGKLSMTSRTQVASWVAEHRAR